LPFQHGPDVQALWEFGREVFEAVYRQVQPARQKLLLDLFHKNPQPHSSQGRGGVGVSLGSHDNNLEV
jgi:hypothetical protein